MNKRKALTLLLSLAILLSLALPAATARADDSGISEDNGDINEVGTEIDGLEINKTAVYNAETGRYTITLEAYATGASTYITQDIPTDFILVLDQSGSMAWGMGDYEYSAYYKGIFDRRNYYNSEYYDVRHNGGTENLWYKLSDNPAEYVAVSVEQEMKYSPISGWNNWEYYENQNSLYCLANGEYKRVNITSSWGNYEYYVDGSKIGSGEYSRNEPTFDNGYAPLYQSVKNYTYSYTVNDVKTIIEESQGDQISPNTQFYQRGFNSKAGVARLTALKNAVTNFAHTVANKAAGPDGVLGNDDDVEHRIAVVGYASQGSQWTNTELFIGAEQHNYAVDASSCYNQAFQNMNTPEGQANITASIGAFDAEGATYTNYGLEMANGILNANPVPNGETRNRVIVLFTDGYPGENADNFDRNAANAALAQATTAKNNGVSLYSVGIFPGADATTAGNYNGSNTDAANCFMQQVSSNNGTPQSPSYYLSASDAGTLNSIFHQISQQIPTGGSNTELSGSAVVKDIISPYFKLPEGANANSITLETYKYNGPNYGAANAWTLNQDASGKPNPMGAKATVAEKEVSVTDFDFADNWCGTEENAQGSTNFRGNKLVIRFDVTPEPGFLGGNDVPTNNTSAGIYKEGETTPSKTFPVPHVNVPIKDVTVTAKDKNVYLKGKVTADQLKDGAEISVGNVTLDLTKENYGLESWQTEYVDITVTVKDKDNNVISDKLEDLKEDTTYTVEVTASPKTVGTSTAEKGAAATAKTGVNDPAANIYVFKPVLTYKDSEAYYGDNAPTDYSGNLVSTEWKHGEMVADENAMGAAPALDISYTPDESKLKDGKYTKQDVPVAATVKIGTENVNEHTTFVHQDCTTACGWKAPATPGAPAFLLHVKTCTLTITKAGNVANEPFVFTVNKDDVKYTEVTIVGADSVTIAELPVGTYSITEDTGWSWRYKDPAYTNNGVELSASNPTGTITCTNTKGNDQWLNDYAVKSNTYQTGTAATDGND